MDAIEAVDAIEVVAAITGAAIIGAAIIIVTGIIAATEKKKTDAATEAVISAVVSEKDTE